MGTNVTTLNITGKYGITENKKAELDALTIKVLEAQLKVEQYESMVTSLTEKSEDFQTFLAVAEANREKALSNKNLMDEVVQNAFDLKNKSNTSNSDIALANNKTKDLAQMVKSLMDELIYAAEVINKLSNVVIRKKSQNPLISDELISRIEIAKVDANNAVALTLVALKSTFAAQASNMESQATATLQFPQSTQLFDKLTDKDASCKNNPDDGSIRCLLEGAYVNAKSDYSRARIASRQTTDQLNIAIAKLSKAQVQLDSLQSGLAAANAAALAS